MIETVPVPMKLQQATIDKIESLRQIGKLSNNADAVRWAVEIALVVVQAISKGDEVRIEGSVGIDRLVLPQLESK